jgi:hypothetical protein
MEHTTSARPGATFTLVPSATAWLRISVLYLMTGVGLGIAMGVTQDFTLQSVHSHLSLLGFAVMSLAGLIYSVYPDAAESRLAAVHFWLHNTALPLMMGSLVWLLLGHPEAVPVLGTSEFVAAGGVVAFAANVFLNVNPESAPLTRQRAPR